MRSFTRFETNYIFPRLWLQRMCILNNHSAEWNTWKPNVYTHKDLFWTYIYIYNCNDSWSKYETTITLTYHKEISEVWTRNEKVEGSAAIRMQLDFPVIRSNQQTRTQNLIKSGHFIKYPTSLRSTNTRGNKLLHFWT